MKNIRIIAVGRLKTPHWKDAAAYYAKRLSHSLRLEESIVKDADPALPLAERKMREGAAILKQVRPGDTLICLDEGGKCMDSRAFADFLSRLAASGKTPCLVIGGAYGLAPEVLHAAAHTLAFGPMTFPHELARVILLEQLYRAECILSGSGYHH
jgi:23S rRNA (pseudouridine1915-N3)-methyltransferase